MASGDSDVRWLTMVALMWFKVDLLSTKRVTGFASVFVSSLSIFLNHRAWHADAVVAINSASHDDNAMFFYFCEFHDTKLSMMYKVIPLGLVEVDLLDDHLHCPLLVDLLPDQVEKAGLSNIVSSSETVYNLCLLDEVQNFIVIYCACSLTQRLESSLFDQDSFEIQRISDFSLMSWMKRNEAFRGWLIRLQHHQLIFIITKSNFFGVDVDGRCQGNPELVMKYANLGYMDLSPLPQVANNLHYRLTLVLRRLPRYVLFLVIPLLATIFRCIMSHLFVIETLDVSLVMAAATDTSTLSAPLRTTPSFPFTFLQPLFFFPSSPPKSLPKSPLPSISNPSPTILALPAPGYSGLRSMPHVAALVSWRPNLGVGGRTDGSSRVYRSKVKKEWSEIYEVRCCLHLLVRNRHRPWGVSSSPSVGNFVIIVDDRDGLVGEDGLESIGFVGEFSWGRVRLKMMTKKKGKEVRESGVYNLVAQS
ncbi:hypothetical protein AKJ16_DCAP16909 [Drosera capensis]